MVKDATPEEIPKGPFKKCGIRGKVDKEYHDCRDEEGHNGPHWCMHHGEKFVWPSKTPYLRRRFDGIFYPV